MVKEVSSTKSGQSQKGNSKMQENSTWCKVLIGKNKMIHALVVPLGGGTFRIIEDTEGQQFTGKKIDASDILDCTAY